MTIAVATLDEIAELRRRLQMRIGRNPIFESEEGKTIVIYPEELSDEARARICRFVDDEYARDAQATFDRLVELGVDPKDLPKTLTSGD